MWVLNFNGQKVFRQCNKCVMFYIIYNTRGEQFNQIKLYQMCAILNWYSGQTKCKSNNAKIVCVSLWR